MKKILIIILLAIPVCSFSQPKLPEGYFWKKLSNGLEVVVIENSKVPLATIEIAVRNGAYTEGPEYSGLSHLFEHMFFKANKDYPDQENSPMMALLFSKSSLCSFSSSMSSLRTLRYFGCIVPPLLLSPGRPDGLYW